MTIRDECVEAAARAIARHFNYDPDALAPASTLPFWRLHVDTAHVALDAILKRLSEPDEGMVAKGASMTDDDGDARAERARGVWWAMLTAVGDGTSDGTCDGSSATIGTETVDG